RALNLRIRRGEVVIIVGESGIGKSVFLKHLIGLEEPSRGSIWYHDVAEAGIDVPIHSLSEPEMTNIRQEIGMVFQASSLFDWMTVQENIALPLEQHRDRLERKLEHFARFPNELLRLLDRCPRLPDAFQALADRLAPTRKKLADTFG